MNRQIMTQEEQRKAAKAFSERWSQRGYEKGEKDKFWIDLLGNVFGVELPTEYIDFEKQVKIEDKTKYIDGYIKDTKVLVEQKGSNVKLNRRGSNGTAFEQAVLYANNLNYDEQPRWIVTSNFNTIDVYDLKHRGAPPERILLKDLEKDYTRLLFLVDTENEHTKKQEAISVKAGEVVSKIYNALLKEYKDPTDEETLKSLNILCVRLVFCFYAEDAGIFPKQEQFYNFLNQFKDNPAIFREQLKKLFRVLDHDSTERDPYLDKQLNAFPYVNGGLFSNEQIEVPFFNEEIVNLILEAAVNVDWSEISPTIFGSVFESTLNPELRHSGGMHYTSIENIHKVIDPLFLDDLKEELKTIKEMSNKGGAKTKGLQKFHNKLSNLNFLDPACGSGNFLTESYLSLRRLENDVLKLLLGEQIGFGLVTDPIKVKINQFYGIEINDFAVSVAKTALWIAESQMMKETQDIINSPLYFLPLSSFDNIHEENSLKFNWKNVIDPWDLDYIIGNPPFLGARLMSKSQKKDIIDVFGNGFKNVGNLDFVSGWFKLSYDFIKNTKAKAALVSTNSIVQGESVGNLWKPLFQDGLRFNFAYPTFKWNNEAKDQAHVYCVILGFSNKRNELKIKKIFYENGTVKLANNINGYLYDGNNIFIESRKQPISKGVPVIGIGNKPIDGGNYLFKKSEMEEFIKKEPKSKKYFRPWYGANEFLKNKPRYCLWLGDASPTELRTMPEVLKRIDAVRNYRLQSKSPGTRKIADNPTHFHVENMPRSNYLLIPEVTTSKRRYIPIGFMNKNEMASNLVKVLPNAKYYHFAILTSNVHMGWMRRVAGRLGDGYRYSKDVVYNNFPWPNLDQKTKDILNKTAKAILAARALYPDSSLADLYDPLLMPPELKKAHELNDKAVMQAYGWNWRGMTEEDAVAELMKLYAERINNE